MVVVETRSPAGERNDLVHDEDACLAADEC